MQFPAHVRHAISVELTDSDDQQSRSATLAELNLTTAEQATTLREVLDDSQSRLRRQREQERNVVAVRGFVRLDVATDGASGARQPVGKPLLAVGACPTAAPYAVASLPLAMGPFRVVADLLVLVLRVQCPSLAMTS